MVHTMARRLCLLNRDSIISTKPPLTLGGTHITTSDVVRVLGVLLTPNLSLDKHFFQLQQLRLIRLLLDINYCVQCRH